MALLDSQTNATVYGMTPLLTGEDFQRLQALEHALADRFTVASPFVPVAGQALLQGGQGLAVYGIATAGTNRIEGKEPSYDLNTEIAAEYAVGHWRSSPFWQFSLGLVRQLYPAAGDEALIAGTDDPDCLRPSQAARFAYGNMYLLGDSAKNPDAALRQAQHGLCLDLLRRQLALIPAAALLFLGGDEFDRAEDLFGAGGWHADKAAGTLHKVVDGRLVLWCYHPATLRYRGMTDAAGPHILALVREHFVRTPAPH
ncbi:hypothetical protein [Oleisolibacter albus]|uniref:hypothetical protein n=1 Tax=Oleisolibacter albus TaxID=2171757 RepID=UPI000DF175DC|nr:hypothetical protein [Oleisolibacter albus]